MTLDLNDEQCKIFVGGLSWDTTDEKLKDFFSQFGHVINACVMKNPETGRSRGFGFVSFQEPESVQNVLSAGPQILDGRTIDPKSCNSKNAHKDKQEAKLKEFPKVFLGGLPPDVNETSLRSHFSKYGRVIEVVIMYNQEKKSRGNGFRGFGFLSFENEDSVSALVSEHFVNINGKKVEVKRAEPRNGKLDSSRASSSLDLLTSMLPTSTVHDVSPLSGQCWSLSTSNNGAAVVAAAASSTSTSPTGSTATRPPPPPPPPQQASNFVQTAFMAPSPFCLPPSVISPMCVASAPWTSLSTPMPPAPWPCPNVPSNFWTVPSIPGMYCSLL